MTYSALFATSKLALSLIATILSAIGARTDALTLLVDTTTLFIYYTSACHIALHLALAAIEITSKLALNPTLWTFYINACETKELRLKKYFHTSTV